MSDGIRARFTVAHPGFTLRADLDLPGRGVTGLLGRSGAGKTLILRALAGLDRPTEARIQVNGELWQDDATGAFVPTHRRALGYVFQEASLFPHLSVRGNLEYGSKRAGIADAAVHLQQTAALLGIEALLARRPDRLSGGERQRVAIARALLARPRLLLFDEPLASLDLQSKADILPYLERLHDELEIPSLYVSHMPDEVVRLADHLVLLEGGNIVAVGPLQDILCRLDLPPSFADMAGVVIDAEVGSQDPSAGLMRLDFAGGALLVPRRPLRSRRVRCKIAARDISITLQRQTDTSILNIVPAVVVGMADVEHSGQVMVQLDANGVALVARITRHSWDALHLAPGRSVWVQIKAVAIA